MLYNKIEKESEVKPERIYKQTPHKIILQTQHKKPTHSYIMHSIRIIMTHGKSLARHCST